MCDPNAMVARAVCDHTIGCRSVEFPLLVARKHPAPAVFTSGGTSLMPNRCKDHRLGRFTQSGQKLLLRTALVLEPLEGRTLLATIVDLGPTGSIFGPGIYNVTGINSTAEVVGQNVNFLAFFLNASGISQTINPASGYNASFANAINDNNQVAGYSE
jgi:hypothetical protein